MRRSCSMLPSCRGGRRRNVRGSAPCRSQLRRHARLRFPGRRARGRRVVQPVAVVVNISAHRATRRSGPRTSCAARAWSPSGRADVVHSSTAHVLVSGRRGLVPLRVAASCAAGCRPSVPRFLGLCATVHVPSVVHRGRDPRVVRRARSTPCSRRTPGRTSCVQRVCSGSARRRRAVERLLMLISTIGGGVEGELQVRMVRHVHVQVVAVVPGLRPFAQLPVGTAVHHGPHAFSVRVEGGVRALRKQVQHAVPRRDVVVLLVLLVRRRHGLYVPPGGRSAVDVVVMRMLPARPSCGSIICVAVVVRCARARDRCSMQCGCTARSASRRCTSGSAHVRPTAASHAVRGSRWPLRSGPVRDLCGLGIPTALARHRRKGTRIAPHRDLAKMVLHPIYQVTINLNEKRLREAISPLLRRL
mmetsp:Transcript_11997/g.29042  ORF Transcript_11997/g.29042 Transcript_11997/m.29042 type:complete len:416 (-) Transcript_11997:240-1487(-)